MIAKGLVESYQGDAEYWRAQALGMDQFRRDVVIENMEDLHKRIDAIS